MTPRYVTPTSLTEVVATLSTSSGTAIVLGGGTMVYPRISRREIRPQLIVDLAGVTALHELSCNPGSLIVGAAVTYSRLIDELTDLSPLLVHVARGITGGPQIRNQGTFAGSVAFANPSSEAPAVLVALGGRVEITGPEGIRTVDAQEFFVDNQITVLGPAEIVSRLIIPREHAAAPWGYLKLKRSESSWPLVTATAVIMTAADGDTRMRLVLGAITGVPVLFDIPVGPDADPIRLIGDLITERSPSLAWLDDELASAKYRARVATVVARRAAQAALRRGDA